MPYGDHLEEGSPRGVSLEPLRKLERVRKQEHDTATHVAALRAAVAPFPRSFLLTGTTSLPTSSATSST